jgi:peptidoglycan/xylan/chitin deacetylase (PgdA/CDA1 family)
MAILLVSSLSHRAAAEEPKVKVPVLVYHRLGEIAKDPMTVTTTAFAGQMKMLHDSGYNVIPLRSLVDYLQGKRANLPDKSVVITADDGHVSVFTDMYPVIKKYNMPVTLFIYPSVISNASYGMTWDQLAEMKQSGLIDIESHSYWHPNFNIDRQRLSPEAFKKFVDDQMTRSRQVLEHHLGGTVDLFAWPFGIYDPDLIAAAEKAGYVAAFSIRRRPASRAEMLMTIPRYIVTDQDVGQSFERLLSGNRDSEQTSGY